jgi:predicted nuclease of predicted toxin-antitoxin system
MRWLADECIDAALVGRLRGAGHDVLCMAESASGGADTEVPKRADDEGGLLRTEDKDFGELVFRAGIAAPGLILLRIAPEKHHLKWSRLEAAIAHFSERLFGRYLVVEEARFRSRPLLKLTG